jgi:cytochrome c peroxidase
MCARAVGSGAWHKRVSCMHMCEAAEQVLLVRAPGGTWSGRASSASGQMVGPLYR